MIDTIAFFVGMFLMPAVLEDAFKKPSDYEVKISPGFTAAVVFIWALSWTIYFN